VFHDGTPVSAADVAFTFQLIKQHRHGEGWSGPSSLDFESIEAVEPYKVRIHFSQPPAASFLYQLREHILPRHLVEPQLQAGQVLEAIPFNTLPLGSGPFQFEGWEGQTQLRLTAFAGYWRGRPYLDTVAVRADYEDTQDLWGGFMRGEVDVASYASPENLESIARNERFEILQGLGPAYFSISLNCRPESLLSDRRLREALSYAVNRRALWQHIGGSAELADSLVFPTGPFMPGSPYNDPHIAVPVYNPARAGALLEAAGWGMGEERVRRKEGRSLELLLCMPLEYPPLQKVAAQLRKNLEEIGVRLHVRTESFNTLYSQKFLEETAFDLLWGGGIHYADPDLTVSLWSSASGQNLSGYSNAEVDSLIAQGRASYDVQQRIQIYRRIHHRITEEYPTLFLCRVPLEFALRKKFNGTELLTRIGLFRSLSSWYIQN
jgi:peptide/nickel transport system substrate-binding protein